MQGPNTSYQETDPKIHKIILWISVDLSSVILEILFNFLLFHKNYLKFEWLAM